MGIYWDNGNGSYCSGFRVWIVGFLKIRANILRVYVGVVAMLPNVTRVLEATSLQSYG